MSGGVCNKINNKNLPNQITRDNKYLGRIRIMGCQNSSSTNNDSPTKKGRSS